MSIPPTPRWVYLLTCKMMEVRESKFKAKAGQIAILRNFLVAVAKDETIEDYIRIAAQDALKVWDKLDEPGEQVGGQDQTTRDSA